MAIVQYILLRGDLNFSRGALIAQACHSSVYSIERYRDHPDTVEYLRSARHMTKIILKIKEEDVEEIVGHLVSKNIDHTVWVEEPENIATCISLRPYRKSQVADTAEYLRRFKLF
ncbi:peptidyl-tRNA hydrolase [Encephalitozoon hellem]|nr:peptidyl-tRNA hydrolase [Encephalitozoon hellem]